jgi:hypothetical protein
VSSEHIDLSIFDRLFDHELTQPLAAAEFDALQRHAAICRDCRDEFARRRERSVQGDDVLSEGQVATILNVVLERGREIERAEGAAQVYPTRSRARTPWAPRLRWGLGIGGALAAACAAFLLMPATRSGQDEWGTKGGSSPRPSRDLFCYEEAAGTARALLDEGASCPPGRAVTVEARGLADFPWVNVVACEDSGCDLVDSQPFDGRPSVSLYGPKMAEHGTFTVFTIWSKTPIREPDVQGAVRAVRSRGGSPHEGSELPFDQTTKQLAARVRAQRSPS